LFCHIEGGTQAEDDRDYGTGKIFGPKRDQVTGEYRRLKNEELYDL
jgi:hypothetical protein